jgi:hypothetical protein
VNVGTATVNCTKVVAVKLPIVPAILMLYCPRVAVELARTVRTEFPFEAGLGEKEAVTPLGNPAMV